MSERAEHPTPSSAALIDGKAFAARVREEVKTMAQDFAASQGRQPGLAVVLVGSDAASQVYVRTKVRQAGEAGIASFPHLLDADTTQAELLALIASLNSDDRVDGILVQLPLPAGLDESAVIEADRKSTRLNSSHANESRMPSSA